MLTANQIRKLHKEGLLEINNIRNLERTANFGDDIENINDVVVEDGKEVPFRFSIRYYNKNSKSFHRQWKHLSWVLVNGSKLSSVDCKIYIPKIHRPHSR